MALPQVPSLNPTPLAGFQPSAANPFANFLTGLTQGIELRRQREKDAHLAALQLRDQAFKEKEADRNYNLAEREFDALAKYRNDTIGLQERDLELRDKKFEVDRDQAYSTMEMQNIAMEQARREQEEELRVRSSQAELRAQTQEAIRLSRPPQTRPSSTGLTKPNGDPLMISGKFNVFSGTRDQLKSRNSKPGNRIVSLDFNDADNQSARGIEIVVPENATDEEVDAARQWVQQTHSFFKRHGVDVPIRRGDGIKRGGRGVSGFFHTEPFFVSNADAAKAIESNSDEYAEIMAGTLGNIPGATFIAPHKQNDPGASRDGINERDFAMQTILPSLQRISQSGRQSNEKQLENLRGIERRFSDLGPAEQAMIQAERNRIRAEDPDAFDRDIASQQMQTIKAASIGKQRQAFLNDTFADEMRAINEGRPLTDVAFGQLIQSINEIDLTQEAQKFNAPLAAQDQAIGGLVTSATALGDIMSAYKRYVDAGVVPNNPVVSKFREVMSKVGLDNSAAFLKGLTEANVPGFARALGHVGVLTEKDVESVRTSLPGAQPEEVAIELYKIMQKNIQNQAFTTLARMADRGAQFRGSMGSLMRAGVPFTIAEAGALGIDPDEFKALRSAFVDDAPALDTGATATSTGTPDIVQDAEGNRYRYKGSGNPEDIANWIRLN